MKSPVSGLTGHAKTFLPHAQTEWRTNHVDLSDLIILLLVVVVRLMENIFEA